MFFFVCFCFFCLFVCFVFLFFLFFVFLSPGTHSSVSLCLPFCGLTEYFLGFQLD